MSAAVRGSNSVSTDPYVRIRRKRWALRIALAALVVGAGWLAWKRSRPPEGMGPSIDAIVERAMEEGPIAGLSVGVARGGRIVYSKGYGFADLENGIQAGPGTVYNVGSITKQFTAAAVLQLAEEGRVNLDAPIGEYLPEVPFRGDEGERVTVRELLDHTAGIRNFTTMKSWWKAIGMEMTPEELADVFADQPLDFPPGTDFSYSNSGYVLLGLLIETVGGQPYGGYLNQHVFVPLKLSRTSYCDSRKLVKNRARGYQVVDGKFVNASYVDVSQAYAAGGLCSNAADLLRWTRLLSEGALIRRKTYERMARPDTLLDGRRIEYGYGLAVGYLDGHRRISHVGGMRGFAGYLADYPDDDLTIVVLTNTEGAAAADVESRIARLLLGLGQRTTRDVRLPPDELARYAGTYDLHFTTVRLVARGSRLHALIPDPGIDDTDLLYQGDGTFQAEGDPETLVRFRMEGDSVVGVTLDHQGIRLEGTRSSGR